MAKIIAWIVLSASALCFIFGAAGSVFMIEEGVYNNSKDDIRKQWFEQVSFQYGLSAIDDLRRERTEGMDTSPYFKYGIIKAESLDGIDLNDEKSYAVRNFSDKISIDDVYTNSVELSDEDQIVYTNGNFLTGGGVELMYSGDNSYVSIYADRICYDEAKGIFVYLAGNEYYPVQQIEVESEKSGNLIFTYDAEKKMYRNEQTQTTDSGFMTDGTGEYDIAESTESSITDVAGEYVSAESTEETITDVKENEKVAAESTEEPIKMDVLDQEYITFDMLDGTQWDVKNWDYLLLDGVRGISMDEIDRVDSSEKNAENADISYTTYGDYYLDGNYTLWVNMGQKTPKITYQLIVLLPQNVGTDKNSTDWYVQANTLLDFVYSMRYTALVVMFFSFIIGVAAFVFLMCAAGHRKGTDKIVTTVWDHMWFDVFAVLIVLAEVFIFYVAFMFLANIDIMYLPFILFVTAIASLCMGWLLLLFLLSFAVRVKLGKWWRHTLCYQICSKIRKFFHMIWENIGFLWKVILVMLVLAFLEGIAVLMFLNTGIAFFLWLVEKLILYPLILWCCVQLNQLKTGTEKIAGGEPGYQIGTKHMTGIFKEQGEQINHISDGMTHAIEERMKSERFKTELITNVSHDIKTPLTSIINYVDLIKRQHIEDPTVQKYLEVLDQKSQRLKTLTEDLVEASRASSGNIKLEITNIDFVELVQQTTGEFEEKYAIRHLEIVNTLPNEVIMIEADGRRLWRVLENLYNNAFKYALEGTRVYVTIEDHGADVVFTIKNVSANPLNISPDELTERFVRGDVSRTTEGSGLGLSIAKDLTTLQGGKFELIIDGDLFKAQITFPIKN